MTREYNWEDIICLIMKDMELNPRDRNHHELWYCHNFLPPMNSKDTCIKITKYKKIWEERLKENTRDKI